MNDFQKKTLEGLGDTIDHERLSRGFDLGDDDNLAGDCVLVIGLNPSGGVGDARRAKNANASTFFYSLEKFGDKEVDISGMNGYLNNNYFGAIFRFINCVMDNQGKWAWSTKEREEIEREISKDSKLTKNSRIILKNFDRTSKRNCTIYVGDMFYYHETKSKKLPISGNCSRHDYSLEMLELHLNFLKNHNKNVKFVYINNTLVSRWLSGGDDIVTKKIINGIPVFFGGMLSGQRAMDVFARERLIREIKEHFTK